MILYLVCATRAAGEAEARRRGWVGLSAMRYATPGRHDVRVATRIGELVPLAGGTVMIKGPDYDEGPPENDVVARGAWFGRAGEIGQRAAFEWLAEAGQAVWIRGEDDVPAAVVNYGAVHGGREAHEF